MYIYYNNLTYINVENIDVFDRRFIYFLNVEHYNYF